MNDNIARPKVSTTFQTDSSLKQNSHRSLLPLVRKCEIISFRCTSIFISTLLLSVSQSISCQPFGLVWIIRVFLSIGSDVSDAHFRSGGQFDGRAVGLVSHSSLHILESPFGPGFWRYGGSSK